MACGCCLLGAFGAFVPRIALGLIWLFTDWVALAFDGDWIVPLAGLVLLPYTTLGYVALWNWGTPGVAGFDWFLVALAFLFDIGHYSSGYYGRGRSVAVYEPS